MFILFKLITYMYKISFINLFISYFPQVLIHLVGFSLAILSQKKIPFVKGSPFKNKCAASMPPNCKQENWKCKKQSKLMSVLFQIFRFLICLNEAKRLQHGETLGCKVPFDPFCQEKAPFANSPFVKMFVKRSGATM